MNLRRRSPAVHVALIVYCLLSAAAMACGLEDPSSVATQRGLLNIAFPKSLYVSNAIWHAQVEGLIERDVSLRSTKALVGFNRISTHLRTIGPALDQTGPQQTLPGFSIVLLETMLWANYTTTPSGTIATVHSNGPRPGDVVIVTDHLVVKAILKGSLAADVALNLGLIRYYGDPNKIAALRNALNQLQNHPIAQPDVFGVSDGTPSVVQSSAQR